MYVPKVNDYVRWTKGVEGWIYFVDKEYITIEASVTPKDSDNYRAAPIHANNRLLVLCYSNQWKELEYIKSRQSIYEEEKDSLEVVVPGAGTKSKQM
jgi:hypothetical protein